MDHPLHVLLLGGSGFVGQAFLRELSVAARDGQRVRALLRRPDAVPSYLFLDKVAGSLEALPDALEPDAPYVLVHFAVKHIDHDGTGYHATNVDATRRLLARLGPRCRGVIYGSSMSVYGSGAQDGVSEAEPARPDTPLTRSRRAAEEAIAAFAHAQGVPAYLLRPRFVVGRGDRFVLPALRKLARARVGIASGAQRFSVIDVADYARVLRRLVDRTGAGDVAPGAHPLNVGMARPVSFAELAAVAGGAGPPRLRVPVTPRLTRLLGRVPHRAADRLATRLALVGLSHWGDTRALADTVGHDLVDRDPLVALRGAMESFDA